LHSCLCFVSIGEVVKIETFLKGDTMKINFNTAQLSRPQRENLLAVLDVLQSENQNEIEITPVEFPLKLKVKLDNEIEMLLGWDPESDSYSGITAKAEPEPEPGPGPDPIPESKKDTVDLPTPEPELDLSPVIVRAEALSRALVNLSKPLNTEQRIEVWIRFCVILSKELWK